MPVAVEMRPSARNRVDSAGGAATPADMIRAFFLSIGQLGDPRIIMVFLKSLIVTIILLAALAGGLWFGAQSLFVWMGAGRSAAGLAGLAAALGALLVVWLLFRAIAIAVVGIFADDVVLEASSDDTEFELTLDDVRGADQIGPGVYRLRSGAVISFLASATLH